VTVVIEDYFKAPKILSL